MGLLQENMEKEKITSFTNLNAWKEGHELVLEVYSLTKNFPKEEMFDLVSQMRRAAVSITSNIAEGFSRQGQKEKIQFYSIAHGSTTELQNQLLVARDVGYISNEQFTNAANKSVTAHKLLTGLIKSIKNK